MTGYEMEVAGTDATPAVGWTFSWVDQAHGVAQLRNGERTVPVLVEGSGTDWIVTLAGRRLEVSVRTHREKLLADAELEGRTHAGPVTIKATLPGLVVAIAVAVGDEVREGQPLLTIEAMKMQNEVRAPRDGRVAEIGVASGEAVGTGAPLLRLE